MLRRQKYSVVEHKISRSKYISTRGKTKNIQTKHVFNGNAAASHNSGIHLGLVAGLGVVTELVSCQANHHDLIRMVIN